jgi:hypothetical protein
MRREVTELRKELDDSRGVIERLEMKVFELEQEFWYGKNDKVMKD